MLRCLKTLVLRALNSFQDSLCRQSWQGLWLCLVCRVPPVPVIRWLRATTAREMEIGVWHSPESPSSSHTNYFSYLSNAIFNCMTCRTQMIRIQCRVLFFSFQKVNFSSVTYSGVRHGVAGKPMSCTARPDHSFQIEGEYKLLGKDGDDSGADHLKQYLSEGHKWDQKNLPEVGMHIYRTSCLTFANLGGPLADWEGWCLCWTVTEKLRGQQESHLPVLS